MDQKLLVSASLQGSGDVRRVLISWYVGPKIPFTEGDRYAVRVTKPEGEAVAESVVLAVEYTRSYPNGKECDGDGCVHVSAKPAP